MAPAQLRPLCSLRNSKGPTACRLLCRIEDHSLKTELGAAPAPTSKSDRLGAFRKKELGSMRAPAESSSSGHALGQANSELFHYPELRIGRETEAGCASEAVEK